MFELNQYIMEMRFELVCCGELSEDLEEWEDHLCFCMEGMIEKGYTPEEAFRILT